MEEPDDLTLADRLAVERTRLAAERTLMAWIRTSLSLVTLGITLYKARQIFCERTTCGAPGMLGPRSYGLIMITLGIVALVLALAEHRRTSMRLWSVDGTHGRTVASIVALLVIAVGCLSLYVVWERY